MRFSSTAAAAFTLLLATGCFSPVGMRARHDARVAAPGEDAGEGARGDAASGRDASGADAEVLPADAATACVPKTCADWQAKRGPQSDGCGGIIGCGTCAPPKTCGGGGVASECGGYDNCVPLSCVDQAADCGLHGDGCGNIISCGSCTGPERCDGLIAPGQCLGKCAPFACSDIGAECGPQGDGCGGALECGGPCKGAPEYRCGGGGVRNACGGPHDGGTACVPLTCAELGFHCGPEGDGCGGFVDCGSCTPPETCGGGGQPGVCGGFVNCVPPTCAKAQPGGANCGALGDGCGGLVDCGNCPTGQRCVRNNCSQPDRQSQRRVTSTIATEPYCP